MNNFNDNQPSSSASQEVSPASGALSSGSRRRLLRGGLVAAPTLLALTSTPVLACNCKLPSGFSASGNLSQTRSNNCAAPGKSPTQWAGSVVGGKFSGTTIASNCTFSPTIGNTTDSTTFMSILSQGNANSNEKALVVAVYLQAVVNGGAGFPSSAQVKKMWNDTVGAGMYTALQSPQVMWGRADVVKYFKYLTGQA